MLIVGRFIVAWVCCALGGTGMCWLWWRWRKNYLWAANKIFLYVSPLFTRASHHPSERLIGLVS